MSKLYLGSIDLTKINKSDIVSKDKNGQPFKNGAKYLNVSIWVNDEPDEDWKAVSIKSGDKDNSYYIGNAKEYVKNNQQSQTESTELNNDDDDELDRLPF